MFSGTEQVQSLWRIPKVARYLDMPQSQVYRLIREGVIPAVRIGRSIRVDSTTLEEFVKNGGKQLSGGWKRNA